MGCLSGGMSCPPPNQASGGLNVLGQVKTGSADRPLNSARERPLSRSSIEPDIERIDSVPSLQAVIP